MVNLTSEQITKGLFTHLAPPGRMKILHGIYDSILIDDSYNASPIAMEKALEALSSMETFDGRQKIAVLGDMLELGEFSRDAHRKVGEFIAKSNITTVITFGEEAQIISDAAIEFGMETSNVIHATSHQSVSDHVHSIAQESDIILVKGSQGSRMEKVLILLLQDPKDAVYLVRQESVWVGM